MVKFGGIFKLITIHCFVIYISHQALYFGCIFGFLKLTSMVTKSTARAGPKLRHNLSWSEKEESQFISRTFTCLIHMNIIPVKKRTIGTSRALHPSKYNITVLPSDGLLWKGLVTTIIRYDASELHGMRWKLTVNHTRFVTFSFGERAKFTTQLFCFLSFCDLLIVCGGFIRHIYD